MITVPSNADRSFGEIQSLYQNVVSPLSLYPIFHCQDYPGNNSNLIPPLPSYQGFFFFNWLFLCNGVRSICLAVLNNQIVLNRPSFTSRHYIITIHMCVIVVYIDLAQLITGIALPLFYSNLKASDLDVFIGISIFDFMIICLLNGIIVNDFRFNSCVFGLFYSQSPSPRISYSENTNAIFKS